MPIVSFRHKTMKWSDVIGWVLAAQTLRWRLTYRRLIREYSSANPCEEEKEEQGQGRSRALNGYSSLSRYYRDLWCWGLGLVSQTGFVTGWGLHRESGVTLGEVSLFSWWQSWGKLNCELSVADSPSIWEKGDLKGSLCLLHHEWSNRHATSAMREVLYGGFYSSIQYPPQKRGWCLSFSKKKKGV